MILDFKAIFQDFVDATQKTWARDRRETVGASEVFGCLRQVWFKKKSHLCMDTIVVTKDGQVVLDEKGTLLLTVDNDVELIKQEVPRYPEDKKLDGDEDEEDSWGATKRGDILEEHYVVPAVRDHLPEGAQLLYAGQSGQQTLFHNNNSATSDGLIVGLTRDALSAYGIEDIGSDCIVLEIKSIDPRVNLQKEKDQHHGQTQIQMGMFRELTKHKPNFAVLLYVDASFLDQISVYIIPFSERAWQIAQKRADLVFATDDPADIPAEGKLDDGCKFCDFQRSCMKVITGNMPPDDEKAVPEEVVLEMAEFLVEYKAIQAQAQEANEALEEARAEIKERLSKAGSRKLSQKEGKRKLWSVSWYAQKGRKGLDKEAVSDAGIDLEPFYVEGNPFDVLRVTFEKNI